MSVGPTGNRRGVFPGDEADVEKITFGGTQRLLAPNSQSARIPFRKPGNESREYESSVDRSREVAAVIVVSGPPTSTK